MSGYMEQCEMTVLLALSQLKARLETHLSILYGQISGHGGGVAPVIILSQVKRSHMKLRPMVDPLQKAMTFIIRLQQSKM